MTRLLTRAWYGGGYYEPPEPPPQPPEPTVEGGHAAGLVREWAQQQRGAAVAGKKRAGDALVLGRFLPLHSGHVRLLTRATEAVSGVLHVVVAARKSDFLGERAREEAVRESVMATRLGTVTTARDVGQQGEPEDDAFWQPWLEWVRARPALAGCKVLVAGDVKAERFAQLLKMDFVLVDRAEFALSATQVREDPWGLWDHIAPSLRSMFTGSVALVGPEGAGKSTLATQLGKHYGTSVAQEYVRTFLDASGAWQPSAEELRDAVWNGTRTGWARARERATKFFIADTDQLSLALWSLRLYGTFLKAEPVRPDFTVLLDDHPWSGPKDRDQPEARRQFVEEFRRLLTVRGTPHVFISGPREGRFRQAVEAIEAWVKTKPLAR